MEASRGDVMATTNEEREMRVAVDRIVGFAKQFDEAHLNLACHAAFPLVLTPDLLYQIWAHFVPEAAWTAVVRVLLSRLCRQVGYEMYEMDIAVRNLLLKELKEQFGRERFDKLAEFLMDYVKQRLTANDPDTRDLAQAQEWTALAYTKPDEAARELAKAIDKSVKQKDMAEVLRLASLVETFAEPLVKAGFEGLVVYSRWRRSFAHSDPNVAVAAAAAIIRPSGNTQPINSNRSFIVDRLNYETLSSGRRVYSFDVFNQGYADGVVEVRNARNELIEFRGIEGIRIPTGIFNFGIQSIERLWRLATEGYDFLDPRNSLGNSQKTEIRDLVVPSGGRLKITKKGDKALIYNQATFLMKLFFDSEFFLGDSPLVKARLLSALCEKLQQEHIGSLVKDGALMTQGDALQSLINGSWINKENLEKLTKIGLQAFAEQGLKGIAGIVINEQVLGRSLGFWVTGAEGFVKGTNVFLQWLDLDRSQRAEEENVTLFIN